MVHEEQRQEKEGKKGEMVRNEMFVKLSWVVVGVSRRCVVDSGEVENWVRRVQEDEMRLETTQVDE